VDPYNFGKDPDPDPVAFKMPTKNKFFKSFFAYYFLNVILNQSSEIKTHKEVTKQWNQGFSYFFFLMIEGPGSIPYK
jgi:hypothetical protein